MKVKPRESILLVENFDSQITWYCDILNFHIVKNYFEQYHYCVLENEAGIKLAIGLASDMGVTLQARERNSVILQFEAEDVRVFLAFIEENNGKIIAPAIHNEEDDFWFGSFADPEGNTHWVVDGNCP